MGRCWWLAGELGGANAGSLRLGFRAEADQATLRDHIQRLRRKAMLACGFSS